MNVRCAPARGHRPEPFGAETVRAFVIRRMCEELDLEEPDELGEVEFPDDDEKLATWGLTSQKRMAVLGSTCEEFNVKLSTDQLEIIGRSNTIGTIVRVVSAAQPH